jgi:hypothetical protein
MDFLAGTEFRAAEDKDSFGLGAVLASGVSGVMKVSGKVLSRVYTKTQRF